MVAGGRVHPLARCAHDRRGHRGPLGVVQHRVRLGDLARRLADVHAAGDVAAVADALGVEHRAAEVAQHDLARPDHPAARLVVGAGGVGAGRHDGEVHVLMALVDDAPGQVGRHVGLAAPGQRDLAGLEVGRDAVDGLGRPPQRRYLGCVLDRPQGPDDARGPLERRARQRGLEVEHEAGPRPVADRHPAGRADQPGDDGDRVFGLAPGPQGEHVGPLGDTGRLQLGDDQRGVAVAGQDQHGQPLERHGRVAGQVGQVRADGQQRDVDSDLGHAGPDPGGALSQHRPEHTASAGHPPMSPSGSTVRWPSGNPLTSRSSTGLPSACRSVIPTVREPPRGSVSTATR